MRSAECAVNNPWLRPKEWWQRELERRYDPALWFYYRMIEVALIDSRMKRDGAPTDEALLARDWIAASEEPRRGTPHEYVSFPECCRMLNLDPDRERVALLEKIDSTADFDVDELWMRLAQIGVSEPKDDNEPLFDGFRCVPALDQMTMF